MSECRRAQPSNAAGRPVKPLLHTAPASAETSSRLCVSAASQHVTMHVTLRAQLQSSLAAASTSTDANMAAAAVAAVVAVVVAAASGSGSGAAALSAGRWAVSFAYGCRCGQCTIGQCLRLSSGRLQPGTIFAHVEPQMRMYTIRLSVVVIQW